MQNGCATHITIRSTKVISGVFPGRASHIWLCRNLCTLCVVSRWGWRAASRNKRPTSAFQLIEMVFGRPVILARYGRSNRKSVGSPEAVPFRSAPHSPTRGIVNI
eukprot:6214685-Pleurochrysis_carterae.AAC.3